MPLRRAALASLIALAPVAQARAEAPAAGALLPWAGARLARGPYLQRPTPSSVVVVWRTAAPRPGEVHVAPAAGGPVRVVRAPAPARQHEVRVAGLAADTAYRYRAGPPGRLAGPFVFRTPPAAGDGRPFRAWIVGDSGTGGAAQRAVRDAMLRALGPAGLPDIFLHLGDMAYGSGTDAEFQRNFFAPYAAILARVAVWPTLGNHEGRSARSGPQAGPYYDAYVLPRRGEAGGVPSGTEAYYAFDHGDAHFVVLDSHDSPREPGGAMLSWLRRDLAQARARWLIAFFHHPPYTKGTHDSDDRGDSGGRLVEMRENALPILEAAGVDLVLAGHSHIYERSFLLHGAYGTPSVAGAGVLDRGDGRPAGRGPYRKVGREGAVYVVAGHGGAELGMEGRHPLMAAVDPAFGSCILDVRPGALVLTNLRADGAPSDRVALVKGRALLWSGPAPGAPLPAGGAITLTWRTIGEVARVRLAYDLGDGKGFRPLAGPIANRGRHAFRVPDRPGGGLRLRVAAAGAPGVLDESVVPHPVVAPAVLAAEARARRRGRGRRLSRGGCLRCDLGGGGAAAAPLLLVAAVALVRLGSRRRGR